MSIGYRKISEMIAAEVSELSDLNDEGKAIIEQLCSKIYMLEVNPEYVSAGRLIEQITGEVSRTVDSLNRLEEKR